MLKWAVKLFLSCHWALVNFYTSVASNAEDIVNSLKVWAYDDGEVVYKAYIHETMGYTEVIRRDNFTYLYFAVLIKLAGLELLRDVETVWNTDVTKGVPTIVSFYKGGKNMVKVVYDKSNKVMDASSYPRLLYAVVNDKHDVTSIYEMIRPSLHSLQHPLSAFEVAEILTRFKNRNSGIRFGGYISNISCLCDVTLREYVFKADDMFMFHEHTG